MTWMLIKPDLTRAAVHAIESGTLWGGALAGVPAGMDGVLDTAGVARMLGAQLLGTAAAALVVRLTEPSLAEVSVANTAGFWLGATSTLAAGALRWFPGGSLAPVAVGGSLIGVVAGALITQAHPVSGARTYLFNLAATVGALAGAGTALVFEGGTPSNEGIFGLTLGGAVVGAMLGVLMPAD